MKVNLLLIAEIECTSEADAQRKLDVFRESVEPGRNYDICLYQTTVERVTSGTDRLGPDGSPPVFYCHECGGEFVRNEDGTTNHIAEDGEIDYDADGDHVPFSLEDE